MQYSVSVAVIYRLQLRHNLGKKTTKSGVLKIKKVLAITPEKSHLFLPLV